MSSIPARASKFCGLMHDVEKGPNQLHRILRNGLLFHELKFGTERLPLWHTYMYAQLIFRSINFNSTPSDA